MSCTMDIPWITIHHELWIIEHNHRNHAITYTSEKLGTMQEHAKTVKYHPRWGFRGVYPAGDCGLSYTAGRPRIYLSGETIWMVILRGDTMAYHTLRKDHALTWAGKLYELSYCAGILWIVMHNRQTMKYHIPRTVLAWKTHDIQTVTDDYCSESCDICHVAESAESGSHTHTRLSTYLPT